jgi:hypothetical protein
MKIVTILIAADDDEFSAIGESPCPLDEWSGVETPGLDTAKIATLHCLLTGDTLQMALDLYQPVYVSASDTIILRLADEALEKLASLDDAALDAVASELAATDEFEKAQWHIDDVAEQLTAIAELAQLAESQGQALFVWMLLAPG